MNVSETKIPGLRLIELDIHADDRGSFREVWQTQKMQALGLPEIKPVQMNVAESKRGVLRGIHAEPWDKYIHLAYGTGVSVILDIREDSVAFGTWQLFEMDRTKALFVPEGLGNSFQATSELAVYTYLYTAHWQLGIKYQEVAFDDGDLAIPWPIQGSEMIVSKKDRNNKTLKQLFPGR